MADLNIEMNVKTNTGYDQLYPKTKSNVVEYTPTANGKESLTSVKLALDSLLRGDYISLANGSSAISYATITQEVNTCQFIKIKNCSSVPTNYGYSTSDNDFLFISIKTSDNIRLIGVDIITKSMFNYVVVGGDGSWTRINDGGNANQLGGVSRTSFMQNYPHGTGLNLNSTTYEQPYVANIEPSTSIGVGLPDNWWHLMYLPHNATGYGCQVAFPLDSTNQKPKYRISIRTTWQAWSNLNDGGNADTIDNYHVSVVTALPATPNASTIYFVKE